MESTGDPIVSVLLPVFNGGRYLAEAVESILNQTFRNFEMLIIDDGSTDQTPGILRSFAARDPRIRVVTKPNEGYTKALLAGLSLARGKYIARMDADDISHPDRFAAQVAFLDENPACAVVGSAIRIIDPEGDPLSHRRYPLAHSEIDFAHVYKGECSLAHPSTMIRRSSLDEAGGYRPEFEPAEDFELWTRLGEKGELANLPSELLSYRLHPKSTSTQRGRDQVDRVNRAIEATWRRRNLGTDGMPRVPFAPSADEIAAVRGFARMAWNSGFFTTSRKHTWRQLKAQPFRIASWKCFVRSASGSLGRFLAPR
jgi:glycosyltransferase involved in cell wall biosynthesis